MGNVESFCPLKKESNRYPKEVLQASGLLQLGQVKLAIWRYCLTGGEKGYEMLAKGFKKLSEELLRVSGITE